MSTRPDDPITHSPYRAHPSTGGGQSETARFVWPLAGAPRQSFGATAVQLLLAILLLSWITSISHAVGAAFFVILLTGIVLAERKRVPMRLVVEVSEHAVSFCEEPGEALVLPPTTLADVVIHSEEQAFVGYTWDPREEAPRTRSRTPIRGAFLAVRLRDGREIPVMTQGVRYDDCVETFARLRVFLRACGWRPADELEAPDGSVGGASR